MEFEGAEFVGQSGEGVGWKGGGDEEGGVGWHDGIVYSILDEKIDGVV